MENNLISNLRCYIMNAIRNNKKINQDIISELIYIIKNYYRLDSYIQRINVVTDDNENIGLYYKGQLTIYLNALKEEISAELSLLDVRDNDIIYFIYYETLVTLLHEIEHINQERMFFSHKDDIESLIIKNSFGIDIAKLLSKGISRAEINNLCKRGEIYYNQNYDISPIERLADVKAFRTAIEVFNFNSNDKSLILLRDFAISNLWEAYMNSYENHLNPTETYIAGFNPYGSLEEIQTIGKSLPFAKRFFYGLEISDKEYDYIEGKANKIFDKV